MACVQAQLHAGPSVKSVCKWPPLYVEHGDHWFKPGDCTLWQADAVRKEWFPISAALFHPLQGDRIPFPPKTKVKENVV